MDVKYLKNDHESFSSNRWTFNSNNVGKIKTHLTNYVRNDPTSAISNEASMNMDEKKAIKYKETESDPKVTKPNLHDDFDDFENYIGPETSDDHTDTDENEEAKKQTANKAKCEKFVSTYDSIWSSAYCTAPSFLVFWW